MPFEFRPNPDFRDEVNKAAIEAVKKIKCPKHDTAATLIGKDPLKWKYCCNELKEKIAAVGTSHR